MPTPGPRQLTGMLPRSLAPVVLLAVVYSCFAVPSQAALVNISNIVPRHNTSGAIMDAHDGSYTQPAPVDANCHLTRGGNRHGVSCRRTVVDHRVLVQGRGLSLA